ncbi:hypothetical protein OKA06_19085 [Novosphingobium sp. MW5]|nr:hypothetical protein [Novosphingobium sp. MW5]
MGRDGTFGEIAHGSMPFLGDCADAAHGRGAGRVGATRLFPALAARRDRDARACPKARAQSTLNINSIHGGQSEGEADFTGLPSPLRAR